MAAEAKSLRCPICGHAVPPRDGTPKNPSFPFCSRTCKLLDLNHWLSDKYRVPDTDDASSDEGQIDTSPKGKA